MTFHVPFLFLTILSGIQASQILVIAPTNAISHFKMIQPLLHSLLQSGHQLTVLSFFPMTENHINCTDIDLRPVLPPYSLNFEEWSIWNDLYDAFSYGSSTFDVLLGSNQIQSLLKSGKKFDLVILEAFACDAILGFPLYYHAPYIAFSPMALPPWLADWVWNPAGASYVPDHMCREVGVDLLARSRRLACQIIIRLASWWYNARPSIQLIRKHFQIELDSFSEIKANLSAMFVNTLPQLGGIRPYLPNVLEVGGMHLEQSLKTLPKDFEEWLDGCTSGVVLFSMGSMVQASTLDPNIRSKLVKIFGRLDQCVLWKWEESIPEQPGNLRTVPWLPQYQALAHPNVKLFIAHGGFHGLVEAIHAGVPILGVPLYGDQMTNLQMLEEQGVAKIQPFFPFDASDFENKLSEMLSNSSYKEKMMHLSRIVLDIQQPPLAKAKWWVEYVLRHKGALHLQHKGVNLFWWENFMLDAWGLIIIVLGVLWFTFRWSVKFVLGQ